MGRRQTFMTICTGVSSMVIRSKRSSLITGIGTSGSPLAMTLAHCGRIPSLRTQVRAGTSLQPILQHGPSGLSRSTWITLGSRFKENIMGLIEQSGLYLLIEKLSYQIFNLLNFIGIKPFFILGKNKPC